MPLRWRRWASPIRPKFRPAPCFPERRLHTIFTRRRTAVVKTLDVGCSCATQKTRTPAVLDLIDEIASLKKRENATILAHYYQDGDIQELADFTGDSLK